MARITILSVVQVFVLLFLPTITMAEPQSINSISAERFYTDATKIDWAKHTLNIDEVLGMKQDERIVFLDLRSKATYDLGHIKGALHIGSDITEQKLKDILPEQFDKIVVYCSYSLYPTRRIAQTDLSLPQIMQLGYEDVYRLNPLWRGDENGILGTPYVLEDMDFWEGAVE